MSDQLTLIVPVKAKPGQEARLLRELKGMLAATRAEAGCINYELHQSQSDPALFALCENWVSQAALDAHFETPYLKAMFKLVPDLAEGPPEITKWTIVNMGMRSAARVL